VVFDRGVAGWDWGHPWSATGDRIAVATRVHGSDWVGVVDVATGSVRLLTEGERGASLLAIGFSPRGNRILFSSSPRNASRTSESSLWSVGVDGSDARLVVDGTIDGEWRPR
jgi:Tol biopolymer transport system component